MVSMPAPDDQGEGRARLERLGGHFLPADDEDIRVGLANQRRQVLGLHVRVGHHGAAELPEPVHAHLFEFVRDENFQMNLVRARS
jgi:hypothetical protein